MRVVCWLVADCWLSAVVCVVDGVMSGVSVFVECVLRVRCVVCCCGSVRDVCSVVGNCV